jgi:hypothetical protein
LRHVLPLVILTTVLLMPWASATSPPATLAGSYDEDTQVLTLSWDAPLQGNAAYYNVYRDGTLLGQTARTTFDDDLSAWPGGHRMYEVTAVDTGGLESLKSNVVTALRTGPISPPPDCDIVGVTIITSPPGVYPAIYWECLP